MRSGNASGLEYGIRQAEPVSQFSRWDMAVILFPTMFNVALAAFIGFVVLPTLGEVGEQVKTLKRERELLDQRDTREVKHAETIDLLRRRQLDNEAKLLLQQERNKRLAEEIGKQLKRDD